MFDLDYVSLGENIVNVVELEHLHGDLVDGTSDPTCEEIVLEKTLANTFWLSIGQVNQQEKALLKILEDIVEGISTLDGCGENIKEDMGGIIDKDIRDATDSGGSNGVRCDRYFLKVLWHLLPIVSKLSMFSRFSGI